MIQLRQFGWLVISILLANLFTSSAFADDTEEFAGTTPCDIISREFLGGVQTNAPCHSITWKLIMHPAENGKDGKYSLAVAYGLPREDDPNQIVDGPKIKWDGRWEIERGSKASANAVVYRLTREGSKTPLRLVKASKHLLHFLNGDKTLRVGNAGWSYTLNRKGQGN
jgi:hypothetical protein